MNAISARKRTAAAIEEVVAEVHNGLAGAPADALVLFASGEHAAGFGELPGKVLEAIPAQALIGCSGGGIIGGKRELEHQHALSLMAGVLPDVKVRARHVREGQIPGVEDAAAWHALLEVSPEDDPSFVVLADPLSTGRRPYLEGLDRAYPKAVKIGGLASGSQVQEGHALFAGARCEPSGLVVMSMTGNAVLDPIIAQGCKPIGQPMLVTSCDGNRIFSLGERRPGEVLRELFESLEPDDQDLLRTSLFVGIQMRDQVEYRHGDFLIRNLLGMLPDGEMLAIAARVERWQVVQFHLRDRHASAADLEACLAQYAALERRPEGALLFSCVGRGEYLYGRPNHDSELFHKLLGEVALGGFFCNGEIGPVAGKTYAHGYTSAFGVFRPRG